ncbi:hypothetical protein V8C40DRAFT_55734 [Trichoderma camerunense]
MEDQRSLALLVFLTDLRKALNAAPPLSLHSSLQRPCSLFYPSALKEKICSFISSTSLVGCNQRPPLKMSQPRRNKMGA